MSLRNDVTRSLSTFDRGIVGNALDALAAAAWAWLDAKRATGGLKKRVLFFTVDVTDIAAIVLSEVFGARALYVPLTPPVA